MTRRRGSGEGSIIQRKDGRWQGALQVDGKRRTVYGKTRQEVVARLDTLRLQVARNGALADPGRRTLNQVLDAWLETKASAIKPSTLAHYGLLADTYIRPALGQLPLTKVTPQRVQQLYTALQAENHHRTARLVHCVLHQALGLAVRWDWLAGNPTERVDSPRWRPARKEMWTREELQAFLDGTRDSWWHNLWVFLIASGCRLGEALALEYGDIDLRRGTVTVCKSGQRVHGEGVIGSTKTRSGIRQVSLPKEAVEALRRQEAATAQRRLRLGQSWQAGDLVFAGQNGGPLNRSTVAHALKRECDALSLPPLTPHGLRHLHASLLLAEGLPIPDVSRRLGHADAGITMAVYAHTVCHDDEAATHAIGRALSS